MKRRLTPSPVVDLNRAVAVSMAEGPAAALTIVDERELLERKGTRSIDVPQMGASRSST